MKRHLRWLVFLAVVCLSAFAAIYWLWPGPFQRAREAAAVKTRWIGMTDRSSCPPATTDWGMRPLFPLKQLLDDDLRRSAVKAGLGRFCVYEYRGSGEVVPELPDEISRQLLPGAETDMAAMTGSADTLEVMTSNPFYERLLEQVGMPTALPLRGNPARLVFLDTEGTGEGLPASSASRSSQHGYTLSRMAGHLASLKDEGPLAVEIASRLTLPVLRLDHGREIRLKSGGFRGTFDDLSRAIFDEIASWKQQSTLLQGPRHLVLNLSLGWDGEIFGGWKKRVSKMPPGVQAVYGALELASDQGVLVIAAAGNEQPGRIATTQPLLPGGWEARQPFDKKWKHRSAPLVYAVSGVDGDGHPLVNTRAKGEAPRVAYADHVLVRSNGKQTATLTGASVAAAVVSTTAALVWRYRPELSSAEVMQILFQSGKDRFRKPDFSSEGTVRQISLCSALIKACTLAGPTCPSFECSPSNPPASMESKLRGLQPKMRFNVSTMPTATPPVNLRSNAEQTPIDTQPGEDPCPNCVVTGPPRQSAAAPFLSLPIGAAGISFPSFTSIASAADSDPEPGYRLLIEVPKNWNLLPKATLEVFDFNIAGRKHLLARRTMTLPELTPVVLGETMEVTGCFAEVKKGTPFQASLTFFVDPQDGGPAYPVLSPLFVEY